MDNQSSGTDKNLYGTAFRDAINGTVVGVHGIVLRSTNGGETWTIQMSGTTNPLQGVYFSDTNNGTAVGGLGTILHTTNGGVTFIEEKQIGEVPTEFLLSQNYPNPFNPTTSIQYAIVSRQFVTLEVYDILGTEIATLVNQEKPAGNYEVNFNASDLPSGVYIYKMKAGEYVETRKMVLLK